MPTYPSSASEVVDPEMEVERGSSSSSRHHSKKPPKGILKNSNPNATYLKSSSHSRHGGKTSGLNKRIEDLIEYERPRASPPQTSGRHVCTDDDEEEQEENSSSSSPSSPSSTAVSEVSSSRRHGQSRPPRDSSSEKHRHHHSSHKSSKHRSHRSSRSSGGQSDASDGGKNDSDASERSHKKRSSSSSTSSTSGHRHHRHHHKSSRSSRDNDSSTSTPNNGEGVGWEDGDEKRPQQHRSRAPAPPHHYADEDDENNIYDMPKMPPVPVALPPPQRYANNEEKDKSSKSVEQLYNKVTKSTSKGLQTSRVIGNEEEDDNVDDLYAQDSLIQVGEHFHVEDKGLHEEGGFYENVGFEIADSNHHQSKKEFQQQQQQQQQPKQQHQQVYTGSVDSKKLNNFVANAKPLSDNFEQKFITVEEALTVANESSSSNGGKKSPIIEAAEALYDVPRSNRRVSSLTAVSAKQQLQEEQLISEAIYVNDGFVAAQDCTYDVPRTEDIILLPGENLPESYDVARTRDSLSTIEEEHQEYEVPRAAVAAAAELAAARFAATSTTTSSATTATATLESIPDENFYENTLTSQHKHRLLRESDLIYSNSCVEDAPKSSSDYGSHNGGDDRSSGYRSSSSPSIQSTEELYVNESAIGSMEDSHASSPELVTRRRSSRNIAESTSLDSLKRSKEKEAEPKRDIFVAKEERNNYRELERERERLKAEEVEKAILKKREEKNRSSTQPPRAFFTDFVSNKIVEPRPEIEIGTKERRKKFEAPAPPPPPPPAPAPVGVTTTTKSVDEKKSIQKDRSVDVYNETVRQRATRSGGTGIDLSLSKDVFSKIVDKKNNTSTSFDTPKKTVSPTVSSDPEVVAEESPKTSYVKKRRAPQPHHKCNIGVADINDDDLPSVRQLRNKFENEQRFASETKLNVVALSSKKREALNKLTFKKGFNVMSSLTRRGASALSVSMHNLSSDSSNSDISHELSSKSSKKRPNIMMQFERKNSADDVTDKYSRESKSESKREDEEEHQQQHQQQQQQQQQHYVPQQQTLMTSSVSSSRDDEYEDDDDIVRPQTPTFQWNPSEVVSRMYTMATVDDDADEDHGNGDDANNLEGYLERLPPGKKKSTIWNSWKRQYFVAKNGLLLIFADKSRQVLMDRIELSGGRVDFMESTMLGIQDRRGHYVVIKCGDAKIATEWEKEISKHVRRDFARTFVIPVALPKAPKLFTNVLVVDFGGASVRAGIAATSGPTLPRLFFPTVMAVGRSNEAEKYFGFDAFAPEVRARCTLRQPMAPSGKIDKLSVDLIALQGIFEKIFKDLDVDPSNYEIQLSAPRSFGDNVKRAIAGMLFDEFSVRSVNMAHQTVFAMCAYNAKSGVVVDLGERMDVVPVVDGYKVSSGVSRSSVGGLEMRHKLQHHLQGRNYSLGSFIDGFVLRYAIESAAYMSRNFDKELERYRQNPAKIDRQIEVSQNVTMELGSERFEACEGLFKPELWGLDQAGVHVLVHKAIRECGVDVRKEVTQSIFLAGGLTLIPGFKERLELEVEKLTPAKPRVHASPYRYHAAYLGACVHANTEAYEQTKVKRRDWNSEAQKSEKIWTL